MENRTAFARAWNFLSYNPLAKWSALASAVGTGLLTVLLLVLLALFVDLLISKGHVPAYRDLDARQRDAFLAGAAQLSQEQVDTASAGLSYAPPAVKDVSALSDDARERLWRAYVWHILGERVGPAAAATYADQVTAGPPEDIRLGLLGLVVRTFDLGANRVIARLASWNPWAWRPIPGRDPNFGYLTGLLALGVGLAFVRAILVYLMNYSAAVATQEAAVRMRRAVYHHTFRLGTLSVRALGPSEAISMFTRHVENVHDALYARLTSLFCEPLQVALLLVFALALHFWLALAFLLFAVIVLLVGGRIAAEFRERSKRTSHQAAGQLALLQESVAMMRLVKGNLMELFNQSRVERQLSEYSKAQLRRTRGEALLGPLVLFLGTLSALVLLYVAGLIVLRGGLGAANLIVLTATLVTAYWPLSNWLSQLRVLRRGRDSMVLLFEFLDRPGEVGQVLGAEFLTTVSKGIEFRDVSLREPGSGRMLLDKVNLSIPVGTRAAVVGPDEHEKQALVYLIPRFLDPTGGEVRVDDKNVRWLTIDSLRAQIGLVMQQNLIFNDTVANNIGCGDPSYTIPQIIEAAKQAHAHHFIQKLPYGYETPIGEMGSSLSIGQKYRIALARVILRDPAIYVIEEPPTPLDPDTKDLIDDTMARILPGKTAIFLAHRVSTIRSCDQVFLLNRGQVQAAGDHRELLAHNDLYKHLHYMEFNEFAELT